MKASLQASLDSPLMNSGARRDISDVTKQRTDLTAQTRAVQNRVVVLKEKWDKLTDLLSVRKMKLEEAIQSQQVSIPYDEWVGKGVILLNYT